MADADRSAKLERICCHCDCSNPPGTMTCMNCEKVISYVPDSPVSAPGATDEGDQVGRTENSSTEEHALGGNCPDCGAEGTYFNNHCSSCDDNSISSSYLLTWNDDRICPVAISLSCPVYIGRVPPVGVELARQIEANYQTVSRMHAELYLDAAGSLYLRDMGSQNGTMINESRMQKFVPQLLKVGDKVSFSSSLSAYIRSA